MSYEDDIYEAAEYEESLYEAAEREIDRIRRERDEARAEIDRLRRELAKRTGELYRAEDERDGNADYEAGLQSKNGDRQKKKNK